MMKNHMAELPNLISSSVNPTPLPFLLSSLLSLFYILHSNSASSTIPPSHTHTHLKTIIAGVLLLILNIPFNPLEKNSGQFWYELQIGFIPANIYLFKFNKKKTRKMCERCSDLKSDSRLPKKIVLFASLKAL